MAGTTKFAMAIHTAGMLAFAESGCVNSESIARSVSTNPVVVRRMIGVLARHGLVKVRKGQGGGAVLAKPPEKITLAEIYRAVERGPVFQIPSLGPKHPCKVGRHVGPVLEEIFADADRAMQARLKRVTLADVIRAVQQKGECG